MPKLVPSCFGEYPLKYPHQRAENDCSTCPNLQRCQERAEELPDSNSELKPCPFCGVIPDGIVFQTAPKGRPAGYVLKITHKDCCFIEQLSDAYYGKKQYCIREWHRRTSGEP